MKVVFTAPSFVSPFMIAALQYFKQSLKPEEFSFRSASVKSTKQIKCFENIFIENKPTVLTALDISPIIDIINHYKTNGIPIILSR